MAGLSGRQKATQTLATQEQNIQDSNKRRFRDRFNKELEQGQKLFTSARAQAEKADDAITEAKRQKRQAIIGAVTGTAMGAIGTPGVSKFGDIFKSIPGALSTVGGTQAATTGVEMSPTQVADVTIPENVFGTEVTNQMGTNLESSLQVPTSWVQTTLEGLEAHLKAPSSTLRAEK